MRLTYFMILIILVLCFILCLRLVHKDKSELKSGLLRVLVAGLCGIIAQLFFVSFDEKIISAFFYGCFSWSVDFMLLFLLEFVYQYTTKKKLSKSLVRIVCFIAIMDGVSLLVNTWSEHVYKMRIASLSDGDVIWAPCEFTHFYQLHLAISYVMVAWIVYLLIRVIYIVSSFYRKKYLMILMIFGVLMALDSASLYLGLPYNISIIFYGIMALALSYYALYYQPKALLTQMLSISVQGLHSGVRCYDYEWNLIYDNDFYRKDTFQKTKTRQEMDQYVREKIGSLLQVKDHTSWMEVVVSEEGRKYFELDGRVMRDSKGSVLGYCVTTEDRSEQIENYLNSIRTAEEESKKKSEFLSRVSHEIRTPVNSIYGLTEMILRECDSQEITNYAAEIQSSSELLIGIINDVLDFSRIEAGKMTIIDGEYETKEIFHDVVHMITPKAEEKGLTLQYKVDSDIPKLLIGDRMRLQQIMINLLTNAVKYTSQGTVTLSASAKREDGDVWLSVSVEDTGMGIKEEDLPKLMNAFERLDEVKNHSIQGTGLGLSIVHLLLDMMGSGLQVSSEYGKGSVFSFSLRQSIADATPMGDFLGESERGKKAYKAAFVQPDVKVLLVDDNRLNRLVFVNLLKQTKVQIVDVESGAECLEQVTKEHFDMIFLDHMMPEMDGVETFKRMKDMEHKCKDTPVIMLTANAIEGAKEEYLSIGFDDFLTKPIIPEKLEEMMAVHLERK